MEIKKKLIECVVSDNKRYLEGTISVIVERRYRHPVYGKIVNSKKKYLVKNPDKSFLEIGAKVNIVSCAPVSKKITHQIVGVLNVK